MPANCLRSTLLFPGLVLATLTACTGATTPRDPGDNTADNTISTFSKSYGGPLSDEARVVVETQDGGFMLFGSADGGKTTYPGTIGFDGAPRDSDFWIQKLDANGNVEHSRTIGSRSTNLPETTWSRVRATSDGGAVLIGRRDLMGSITRPSPETPGEFVTERIIVGSDIAIARLDANGNTIWSVTHDSGPWQSYSYFARDTDLPEARDDAKDVWAMRDGSFLVAATSTANLDDTLDFGFPCDDEELNEFGEDDVGYPECNGGGPQSNPRFIGAMSVVLMCVNADGSVRWVRRLNDNPFDKRNNAKDIGLMIRGTADGGSVLARSVGRNSILVRRLAQDGSPFWRTAIYGAAPAHGESGSSLPRGLIETSDGFTVAGERRVIRLETNGSVRWNEDFGLDVELPESPQIGIHALSQQCDGQECFMVAAGEVQTQASPLADPELGRPDAFVAFLDDDDGDLRGRIFSIQEDGPVFNSFTRIAVAGNSLELLGTLIGGGMGLVTLDSDPGVLEYRNLRRFTDLSSSDQIELRSALGLVLITESEPRVEYRDAQGTVRATLPLDTGREDSDVLRAAADLGSGRYVVTGTKFAPGGRSGLVAMRYDVDQNGARVVWQRRIPADGNSLVDTSAVIPSGDGGAVMAVTISDGEESIQGSLVKLDANGNRQWQAMLNGHTMALRRMPDGSLAALTYALINGATYVTRVSAAGTLMWHNRISLPGGSVETMVARPDGGLVLAGASGSHIDVVWLSAGGTLESASQVQLPFDSQSAPFLEEIRIALAPEGGVILAMTETGLLTDGSAESLPLGESNILVIKLDSGTQTVWSRIYGARYDEGVRDLTIRDDGTIAIAGYSDSLGERREAWLLKLSPHGVISDAGCQALLASLPPALSITVARSATLTPMAMNAGDPLVLPDSMEDTAPQRTPVDHETARQCLGDARAGRPQTQVQRLEVVQTGNMSGGVTSTPAGIACGTGANICRADFPQGGRVTLRADSDRFMRWVTECDEGSGGSSLTCVVHLNEPRRIEVEFFQPPPPPPPPQTFRLEFTVLNRGFVSTDSGITCTENDTVATCSQDLPVGTVVNAMAAPDSGLVIFTWGDADPLCRSFGRDRNVQFTMQRNVRCQVQFSTAAPGIRFDLDVVGVGGSVRDEDRPTDFMCRDLDFDNRCRIFLPANTRMVMHVMPEDGWHFAGWGGDCANFAAPFHSFNLTEDMACVATFHPDVARLTVLVENATVGRAVTSQPGGIECTSEPTSDCMEDFQPGLRVTLRASPAGFRGWQGCDRVIDVNYCEVNMNQARTVSAMFTP